MITDPVGSLSDRADKIGDEFASHRNLMSSKISDSTNPGFECIKWNIRFGAVVFFLASALRHTLYGVRPTKREERVDKSNGYQGSGLS